MDKEQFRSKWQERWAQTGVFAASNYSEKPPYYVLDMFPYPSGSGLHVGHAVGYIATDIIARKKRMEGYNVLHPMGWDAFGLPAEQYAIKTGVHPAKFTRQNCETFKRQMMLMGLGYDWDREIDTSDKNYFRWTQFLFLELYKRGLVYEKEVNVWWCGALQTVLADEEVLNGRSERGDHPCEKRPMSQWVVRITEYAEKLLKGLDDLDWPESVKKMQREWIGRTEGIDLELLAMGDLAATLTAYVTHAEALYGANAVLVCTGHPYVKALGHARGETFSTEIADLENQRASPDGIFLQCHVTHPLTGELLPIYAVNYLPPETSEMASLSIPEFDPKARALCLKLGLAYSSVVDRSMEPFRIQNSAEFNGMSINDVRTLIENKLVHNHFGIRRVRYRMRDWVFSRQRYWGEPFPLYRDAYGQVVAADPDELPIELPDIDDFRPSSSGASPLQRAESWIRCENDSGQVLNRITDTMPGWAGSCWYFLRFMDPNNHAEPFSATSMEYWNQVDLYVGGAAHATMHLLYARFWHKVLFDAGLVGFDEPFKKLFNQGLVTADAFKDVNGRIVAVDEAEFRNGKHRLKSSGEELKILNTKMSKSLLNVVVPDDVIRDYGVDTFRVYMMFIGPLGQDKKWGLKGISGCERFLKRVWCLFSGISECNVNQEKSKPRIDKEIDRHWASALQKINRSFDTLSFNTAIAAFMEFINYAEKRKEAFIPQIGKDFVKALFPFAPHLCSELWERLGNVDLDHQKWPVAGQPTQSTLIYINGKYIADLVDGVGVESTDIALAQAQIESKLKQRQAKKIIYIPGKLVNFICGD